MNRMRRTALVLVLSGAVALSGCASQPNVADELSSLVVSAADSIAAGDVASASATLDQLEARVGTERESGTLSAEQADAALATIASIRAELLAPATPSPSPTPSEEAEAPDSSDDSGPGNDDEDDKPGPPDKDKGPGKDKP